MKTFLGILFIAYIITLSNATGWAFTKRTFSRTFVFSLIGGLYFSLAMNLIFIIFKM